MMMMTAKVNIKKLLIALMAAVALIIALISILGGKEAEPSTVATMSDNGSRVQFLESQGWQVVTSPKEACQV